MIVDTVATVRGVHTLTTHVTHSTVYRTVAPPASYHNSSPLTEQFNGSFKAVTINGRWFKAVAFAQKSDACGGIPKCSDEAEVREEVRSTQPYSWYHWPLGGRTWMKAIGPPNLGAPLGRTLSAASPVTDGSGNCSYGLSVEVPELRQLCWSGMEGGLT